MAWEYFISILFHADPWLKETQALIPSENAMNQLAPLHSPYSRQQVQIYPVS